MSLEYQSDLVLIALFRPHHSVSCGALTLEEHREGPMQIVLPEHLNPVIVSPDVVLNRFVITFGRSFLALPDFLDSKVSRVVEFFRISSMWNFRKLRMIPKITRFKMNAMTIVMAET